MTASKNGKPKAPPGRPKIEIDEEQVLKLASINCSFEEMGTILGCSVDTLARRFADVIERGRANMRVSLKRTQYRMAMGWEAVYDEHGKVLQPGRDPDKTMLIWLGKIILHQREEIPVHVSGEVNVQADELRAALESRISGLATRIGEEGLDSFPDAHRA